MTSVLRAEPGEAWARDEAQAVHLGRHRRAPEARSSYREVFAIGEFQGPGILADGAVAQLIGAPLAVGLVGLTAATMLAMSWTHLRGRLIQARPNGPESPGPGG